MPSFITFQLLLDIILVILIWVMQKCFLFIVFCTLTAYVTTVLKLLINFRAFLGGHFFHIFYIDNHFICEQEQFYLFLLNCISLIFLFCLIALARTYSTMLKGVLRGNILALFPILVGNT